MFQQVEGGLLAAVDASRTLATHAKTIPAKIEKIEEKICKKKACLGPIISEFMKKGTLACLSTWVQSPF